MKSKNPAGTALPLTEIEEALSSISDAGWIRLRKVARIYSQGRLNPDDLLQKVFLTTLEGQRNFPDDLDIVQFLAGVMRSLASSEFKSKKRKPEFQVVSSCNDEDEAGIDPADERPNAEQEYISNQETAAIKTAILALFQDDEMAQIIIEGDMEGMEASELRDLTGFDKKSFASKRRLVRRRIERAFPEGWKQ